MEPIRGSEREIAHVLFMDLVGYSLLTTEDQSRLLSELQYVVRNVGEFRRAEASDELIRLPTGDGLALVFFRDPLAPVQCALEITRAIHGVDRIRLRMGIHSGPVHRVRDINGTENVAGSGMNIAQRVMDCGDTGHILVSQIVADLLRQLGDWDSYLHDLGECEVKHGERVHLFNLYADDIGNKDVPERMLVSQPVVRREEDPAATEGSQKVALLYKRNAVPDTLVLQFLEDNLTAFGHKVFVDRHLSIGVEWAREIERQLKSSDAVVPLLSEAAISSEMLEYEIETAYHASQDQAGKPRILPVRICYEGPLSSGLASILDSLNYFAWKSSDDNQRLLDEILKALGEPARPPAPLKPEKLEPAGGAVPLDSQFYVVRSTDKEFDAAMARQDSIILIKGARQMGKTSLLARGLRSARKAGLKIVLTDFQKLSRSHLSSPKALFLALGETIADQLDLDTYPADTWDDRRGPNTNFERYLRRYVLKDKGVVWAMDEVDRLFGSDCGFSGEVFGLFRSWHNERSLDPDGPWNLLTLAIAYATEAHLFISDMNQSPFNVGTRITLQEFTFEQVLDLNHRYGSPLRDTAEQARFYRLLGGHPYLTRRGLNELTTHGANVSWLESEAGREEGPFGDHLRRILVSVAADPEMHEAMGQVLKGHGCPTPETFYRLRSAGVVCGESARDARPRCQLYSDYLGKRIV